MTRSDVKNSLLQAYGAAMMVEPLDSDDLLDLGDARGFIRAAIKAWDDYDAGKASVACVNGKDGERC